VRSQRDWTCVLELPALSLQKIPRSVIFKIEVFQCLKSTF
jgi:hypothetical protein